MISPNDPTESAAPTPFPATESRVFYIDDGSEHWWYAARDKDHALSQLIEDTYGGTLADYLAEYPDATVIEIPEYHTITVVMEQGCTDEEEQEEQEVTMTAREWCVEIGGEGCIATSIC